MQQQERFRIWKKRMERSSFCFKGGSEQTHDHRWGKFFFSRFFGSFDHCVSLLLLLLIIIVIVARLSPSSSSFLPHWSSFSGFGRKFLTRFLRHRLIINFFTSFSSQRKREREKVCERGCVCVCARWRERDKLRSCWALVTPIEQ